MTDEQMRIKIAGACGWKQTHFMQMGPKGKYVRTYQKGRGKLHQKLPDYLNDLNAMHEAEKVLTDDDHRRFRQLLFTGFYNRGEGQTNDSAERARTSATARQRAEAFLKTLNLWKD